MGLRFIVGEVNFLKPEMMNDPILDLAIVPGSAGHDEWGFRNREVPREAKIVAIGDSQTYGTSAPADQAWPAWLGRFYQTYVYNMGVGGLGPPEYRYLLHARAKLLNPELIFIGFYFGNDLYDSYEFYHVARKPNVDPMALDDFDSGKFLGNLRDWLSRNSLIYQMSKSIMGELIESLTFYDTEWRRMDRVYPVITENWRTLLEPEVRYAVLDQSKEANRIGLSESLEALDMMNEDCQVMKIRCVVVLIPTKITVYWPVVREFLNGKGYQDVKKEAEEESRVRHMTLSFLIDHGIEFVDPTEALQTAARADPLYPANADGHLNARGNEVLATDIFHKVATSIGAN